MLYVLAKPLVQDLLALLFEEALVGPVEDVVHALDNLFLVAIFDYPILNLVDDLL